MINAYHYTYHLKCNLNPWDSRFKMETVFLFYFKTISHGSNFTSHAGKGFPLFGFYDVADSLHVFIPQIVELQFRNCLMELKDFNFN